MEGRPERAHLQAGPRSHKPPSRLPSPTPFVFLKEYYRSDLQSLLQFATPSPTHPFNTE